VAASPLFRVGAGAGLFHHLPLLHFGHDRSKARKV
jgi:hypothetical protein